jgi:hypothetical protein
VELSIEITRLGSKRQGVWECVWILKFSDFSFWALEGKKHNGMPAGHILASELYKTIER